MIDTEAEPEPWKHLSRLKFEYEAYHDDDPDELLGVLGVKHALVASPAMERKEPDTTGDDLTLLTQFLDYQRATIVQKAEGLTAEQLAHRIEPATMTLPGLVKHLALVEDIWFQVRLQGLELRESWASVDWTATPDWDFDTAVDDDIADLVAMYEAACERSRAAVEAVGDLDAVAVKANRAGDRMSLRWILIHMIEETARHAGHADLLRETIDGVTGD